MRWFEMYQRLVEDERTDLIISDTDEVSDKVINEIIYTYSLRYNYLNEYETEVGIARF